MVSWGDPREVVARCRADRRSLGMSPRFRDVGIGIARFRGVPFYAFLFGWHQGDHFASETAALRDLERVRAEMLDRVNAARRSAGLAPLQRSPDLDRAAQGADPVYKLMGARGLTQTGMRDAEPKGEIDYFIRSGGHGVRVDDWDYMLDWLDRWLTPTPSGGAMAAP